MRLPFVPRIPRVPFWEWGPEREGLATRLALCPLELASFPYRFGASWHRRHYERGAGVARRLPCRVISVGGLGVGGAAKTPIAATLAAALRQRGHRVALASRGYRRQGRDAVHVVSDGSRLLGNLASAGEEALLLAAGAPGVPVLVGRDRGVVGLRAVTAFGADVLVLDDGFQHHRLARDVDVVVFDGRFGFGNRRLLPRGPLREAPSALSRAHAVGILDGPLSESDAEWLSRFAPGARRFEARRRPLGLRLLSAATGTPLVSVDALRGLRVGALCAIARPAGFRRSLESLGAEVVAERFFRDHHRYRPRDLRGLDRALDPSPDLWVTTEKDAVKISSQWLAGNDLRVLATSVELAPGEGFLPWLDSQLRRPRPAETPYLQSSTLRQGAVAQGVHP